MKRSLKNSLLCGIFLTGAIIAACLSFAKKQETNISLDQSSSTSEPQVSAPTLHPGTTSASSPSFSGSEFPETNGPAHPSSQPRAGAQVAQQARYNPEQNTPTPLLQRNSGRTKRQNRHMTAAQEPESFEKQTSLSSDETVAMESQSHEPELLPPAIAAGQPIVEEALPPLSLAVPDQVYDALTEREREMIHSEGEKFVDSIQKSPDADPESPAYFDHWKSARRLHDEHLRISLGWDRFNQLSAAAAAAAEAKKADSRM